MGAGASAIPVDQLTNPAERALYDKLKAQYDEEVESCETDTAKAMLMKKLRQQYDEQVLAGGPLRDWLDDHSAMQCAEAATPVEVKADVAEE